ncbi:fatty acid oxidation complex subunit alpha FadJ [Motilimonas eburnea]|uniref:fatty acid oxidation complex subunit alpha FadJ n=1 Tax=Motilimonas eburnea TaxID=1737488 RepID=UPI001E51E690|nr:fatty acid oxidation complex subunit alpha FadJ [Motilimonas eburnea]MCE2572560.1 fatty acid oxidation complex subunit alpha FadJ [Motilimonas eburnea]
MADLTLVRTAEDIAQICIAVEHESVNTLSEQTITEMTAILDQLEQDKQIKGLVIYSGKKDCFVAGADVKMLDACDTAEQASTLAATGQTLFARLSKLPYRVVAAIDGSCLGGGLELALACDYRLVSDNTKTRLGLPEVQLGLLPGSGGTQRLVKQIGLSQSLGLILTGKQLHAKAAVKLGLADDMVAQDVLLSTALTMASEPKKVSRRRAKPMATRLMDSFVFKSLVLKQAKKRALSQSKGHYPAIDAILTVLKQRNMSKAGFKLEADQFGQLVMTSQSKSLRRLFFASTAAKKKRKLSEYSQISQVWALGGGLMGGGIAYTCVNQAKVATRIKDINPQGVANALAYGHQILAQKRRRGHLNRVAYDQIINRYSGSLDYQGLNKADLVIEAVFEDLKLKQQMVADVEQYAKPDTIFASNTSSIPIAAIAENAQRPENIIGLHYFSPAEKMPLVEVIPHALTSEQTLNRTLNFAISQGKTPIVVKDEAGFYVNRILAPYINEAARILLAGEQVVKIDTALTDFGFPVGPFRLLDEVGLDVAAKIAPILTQQLGKRFTPPDVFPHLLNDQRLGKKSNKGFYRFDDKKSRQLGDDRVYDVLDIRLNASLSSDDIAWRCVLQMVLEACRCLHQGVVASDEDADVGAVFGIGFPPYLGGPMNMIRQLGAGAILDKCEIFAKLYGERFVVERDIANLINEIAKN